MDYVVAKLKGEIVGSPMISDGARAKGITVREAKEVEVPSIAKNGNKAKVKTRKVYADVVSKDAKKAFKDWTGLDADEFVIMTSSEVDEQVYAPLEAKYNAAIEALEKELAK